MIENLGMTAGDAEYEVRRYIGQPGQATAYWIGRQRILDLRQQAMDALGESFDLAEFHSAVLASGALPLNVLSSSIETYIDAGGRAPGGAEPVVVGLGRRQGMGRASHGPGAVPARPGRPGPSALERVWRMGACSPATPGCRPEPWLRGDDVRAWAP